MINLLWLFIIYAFEGALLWTAYKFLGKTGLFSFGVFAIIQAIYQVTIVEIGSISIIASLVTWLLFLFTIILFIEKYGKKSAITFITTILAVILVVMIGDWMISLATSEPMTFSKLWSYYGINFVVVLVEGILAILLNKALKSLEFLWGIITLAILVVFDSFFFVCLLYIGLPFGEIMSIAFGNLWQKLIIVALLIPVFYAFEKTKVVEFETLLVCKSKTKNEQPVEAKEQPIEEKQEEILIAEEIPASEKAVKKTAKKSAVKKEEKPAKKTSTKTAKPKTTTKKVAKKSTKKE